MIFLRFAGLTFTQAQTALAGTDTGRRTTGKAGYQVIGVLYLAPCPGAGRTAQPVAHPTYHMPELLAAGPNQASP